MERLGIRVYRYQDLGGLGSKALGLQVLGFWVQGVGVFRAWAPGS